MPHGLGKLFHKNFVAEGNFYKGKLDGEIKITDTTTNQVSYKKYWRGLLDK